MVILFIYGIFSGLPIHSFNKDVLNVNVSDIVLGSNNTKQSTTSGSLYSTGLILSSTNDFFM